MQEQMTSRMECSMSVGLFSLRLPTLPWDRKVSRSLTTRFAGRLFAVLTPKLQSPHKSGLGLVVAYITVQMQHT
jgi:hypothetical protein